MYGLDQEDILRINRVFEKYEAIEKAVLYGSRAKATFRDNSDIDLTLKSKDITGNDQFMIEIELDDLLLPYKIDLSIYHRIKNQDLADHINRAGQMFYEAEI